MQLVTASGRRIELPAVEAIDQGSRKTVVATPCTADPIVAVRVHVASQRVAGWNELDAIGLVPCA